MKGINSGLSSATSHDVGVRSVERPTEPGSSKEAPSPALLLLANPFAGIAEGVLDWRDIYTKTPGRPPPTNPSGVSLWERPQTGVPQGIVDVLGKLDLNHWFIKTPSAEGGMGPVWGPFRTAIVPHGPEDEKLARTHHEVPGVDPKIVSARLESRPATGPFIPFLNDCNQIASDILVDAGADPRTFHALSPVHSRGLHKVLVGRASTGDTALAVGLELATVAWAICNPVLALASSAASYLSGTVASHLEAKGQTKQAEEMATAGLATTAGLVGASLGLGPLGGLACAAVGAVMGYLTGKKLEQLD